MKSSEERRNDPNIRQTVVESLDVQIEAVEQARKLIVEAEKIIHDVPYFNEADSITVKQQRECVLL